MSTRHIGDVSPCRSAAPIHQVARLHRAAGGRGRQATGVARLFCAHAWMTPGITVPFFACTPPTAAAALPQGLSLFVTFCRVVAVICQSRAKDPLDPSLAPMSKNGNNQTHTQRQCQSANHFSSATDNVPTCFTSPRVVHGCGIPAATAPLSLRRHGYQRVCWCAVFTNNWVQPCGWRRWQWRCGRRGLVPAPLRHPIRAPGL